MLYFKHNPSVFAILLCVSSIVIQPVSILFSTKIPYKLLPRKVSILVSLFYLLLTSIVAEEPKCEGLDGDGPNKHIPPFIPLFGFVLKNVISSPHGQENPGSPHKTSKKV